MPYPGLIEEFNIPLDEYPRRCEEQIKDWEEQWQRVSAQKNSQEHERSHEYGSYIIEAAATDRPYRIHGNIMNNGFITNLPSDAIVEVPCLVDRNGIQGTCVGRLPEVCASLNRTNVNVHLLVLEAALRKSRESIYHAAYLDPHTASELTLDGIRSLCDELIEAHKDYLPEYK